MSNNSITLKNVILRYENIFEAKAMQNPDGTSGKPQFSATFILDKVQHKDVIAQVEKLTERVALDKFGKKVKLRNSPVRDGSEKEKAGFTDAVVFIGASSKERIPVVDGKKTPLTAADGKVHWGCIVNAVINLYAWDHKPTNGKGVSAGLGAIQFVKEGPVRYGADQVDVDKAFDEVEEEDALS